jgi:hypothetical protein
LIYHKNLPHKDIGPLTIPNYGHPKRCAYEVVQVTST